MDDYKKSLKEKLEQIVRDVEANKNYFAQIVQDYTEEYYFSGNPGDKWEAEEARRDLHTARVFTSMVNELIAKLENI